MDTPWVPFLENSGWFSDQLGFIGAVNTHTHKQLHILTFGVYARGSLFRVETPLSGAMGWNRVSVAAASLSATKHAAEKRSSGNQHQCCGPADVEGFPELTLQGHVYQRVVEVSDDGIGNPADRDEHHQASDDEEDSGCQQDAALHVLVVARAPGTLHSEDGCHKSQEGQDGRSAHQSSGCLEVRSKSQQRVVDLALHPDIGVPHAVHPQAFPEVLKNHDVTFDEGRHSPLGHDGHCHCAHHANTTKHQSSHLENRGCHGPAGVLTSWSWNAEQGGREGFSQAEICVPWERTVPRQKQAQSAVIFQ